VASAKNVLLPDMTEILLFFANCKPHFNFFFNSIRANMDGAAESLGVHNRSFTNVKYIYHCSSDIFTNCCCKLEAPFVR
jgi:hypothetical protein